MGKKGASFLFKAVLSGLLAGIVLLTLVYVFGGNFGDLRTKITGIKDGVAGDLAPLLPDEEIKREQIKEENIRIACKTQARDIENSVDISKVKDLDDKGLEKIRSDYENFWIHFSSEEFSKYCDGPTIEKTGDNLAKIYVEEAKRLLDNKAPDNALDKLKKAKELGLASPEIDSMIVTAQSRSRRLSVESS